MKLSNILALHMDIWIFYLFIILNGIPASMAIHDNKCLIHIQADLHTMRMGNLASMYIDILHFN